MEGGRREGGRREGRQGGREGKQKIENDLSGCAVKDVFVPLHLVARGLAEKTKDKGYDNHCRDGAADR